MSSPSMTMAALPPELLFQIASQVAAAQDFASLSSLALLCRFMRPVAQADLFYFVHVDSTAKAQQLLELLARNTSLRLYI